MGNTRKFFVKFVRFNDNVVDSLIHDKIKFSTIYELNDFNEFSIFQIKTENNEEITKLKTLINKELSEPNKIYAVLRQIIKSGINDKVYICKLEDAINQYINNGLDIDIFFQNSEYPYYCTLVENIAYHNIGIFSCSRLEVFDTDAAQLMFAHYGDNNNGVALIYEIPNTTTYEIDYCDHKLMSSTNDFIDHVNQWCLGIYNPPSINSFLKKSQIWGYENENRIFSKPGLKDAAQFNIKLKGIFHTTKMNEHQIKLLQDINSNIYNDNLTIKELYCSHSGDYQFRFFEPKKRTTKELILDILNKS